MLDKPKRPMLQEAAALLTVGVVLGGLYLALNWGDAPDGPATEEPARSATVSGATGPSGPQGLGPVALKSLATEVAQALAKGDTELASQMIGVAMQLTGCALHGFTAGPTDPPGLEDLSTPKARAWIKADAAERGIDVGFGHKGKTWIVVAQACGGEDLT